jgi:hypothetical protein
MHQQMRLNGMQLQPCLLEMHLKMRQLEIVSLIVDVRIASKYVFARNASIDVFI